MDDAFCPFQFENLCTAREPRPLGCRVYFCDPAYQETGQRISEKYVRQLKDLSNDLGLEWRYAPLHVFLNEHTPVTRRPERSAGSADCSPRRLGSRRHSLKANSAYRPRSNMIGQPTGALVWTAGVCPFRAAWTASMT